MRARVCPKSSWESSEPVIQPAERVYGHCSLRFKTAKSITIVYFDDYARRRKSIVRQGIWLVSGSTQRNPESATGAELGLILSFAGKTNFSRLIGFQELEDCRGGTPL